MNDEIKIILREAQIRVNQGLRRGQVARGYTVVLIESERTESDIQLSVDQALRDRETMGIGTDDNISHLAPLTLDGASSKAERDLIEAALRDLSAVPDLEK